MLALVGERGIRAVEAAREHGTGNAGGPLSVLGRVELRGDGPAVFDNGAALVVLDRHLKRRDVAVVDVWVVGEVDHQRREVVRRGGKVGGVAAEKGRAGVEAEVDKGVLVRHGRKAGVTADGGAGALVGGDGGCSFGPASLRVGGRVQGEDDVDGALGMKVRVVGDVLLVLGAVDEGEIGVIVVEVGGRVEAGKGVWRPIGDVLCAFVLAGEDALESCGCKVWDVRGNIAVVLLEEVQDLNVEDGRRCAQDKSRVVKALHAALIVSHLAVLKLGANIFERDPASEGWVRGAELPRVKLVDGCVCVGDGLFADTLVGQQEREGCFAVRKGAVVGDGAICVARAAVAGVYHLVRQHAAKVIGDGGGEAGLFLVVDLAEEVGIVLF